MNPEEPGVSHSLPDGLNCPNAASCQNLHKENSKKGLHLKQTCRHLWVSQKLPASAHASRICLEPGIGNSAK